MDELSSACIGGNIRKVKKLLSIGADPNSQEPLYWSCRYGYSRIAELLLKHGADPFIIEKSDYKIQTLTFIIKNNLVDQGWLEENFDRIPQKVWERCYRK
jgi:ankyrin repeat protein